MAIENWVGLPHKIAADPRNGSACDCLLMAFAIADEAGIDRPVLNRDWFRLYRDGDYMTLTGVFMAATRPISVPVEASVALHQSHGHVDLLGVCTYTKGGVAAVSEESGVHWMPFERMPGLVWRRWRQ